MPSSPWPGDENGNPQASQVHDQVAAERHQTKMPKGQPKRKLKGFSVQFELPCEDPVNNVTVTRQKGYWHFCLPINHPSAHNIGFQDLIAAVERAELLKLSTTLNNTVAASEENQ